MKRFKRNVYLDTYDLDEARKLIDEKIIPYCHVDSEEISVEDSLHRVTTEAVSSKLSSPFYNAAAMDGIAVIVSHTHEADFNHPVTLKKDDDFIYVNTGDPIHPPYDGVIMIEDVIEGDENEVTINKTCSRFQHIRPIGEDIVANDMIIPAAHKIRPVDISAMIAGGIKKLSVYKKPMVSIIPTGDEIISNPKEMEMGKIIDSNSHFLKNSVIELGGKSATLPPVKDDYESIKKGIIHAVDSSEMVLVVAGSSSGSKDYTAMIIRELGEVFVHGIAMKPGKPVIIGLINNKPVIGIPGYPVSTYIAFEKVVEPILNSFYKQNNREKTMVKATLTKKIYSSLNNVEYVRVKCGIVNDKLIATPLHRGAGVTMSLVKADGLLEIDKNLEGYEANSIVNVELFKKRQEIKQALVSIGSHDIILDVIANALRKKGLKTQLSSAHVGSFSGVMAIKRGECHMAPIHILDEETGNYNEQVLKKYFNDEVALLKGIKREQGLMVRKDSDKSISSISDLIREDISFINRQKGSGTRILLDYLLKENHIDKNQINGYEFEVTTHMMVASSVYSKAFDCGLGVKSAAKIFDLDFIPIGYEDYDFLILKSALNDQKVQDFIKILKSEEFKIIVEDLGGYKIDNIGEFINEGFI